MGCSWVGWGEMMAWGGVGGVRDSWRRRSDNALWACMRARPAQSLFLDLSEENPLTRITPVLCWCRHAACCGAPAGAWQQQPRLGA